MTDIIANILLREIGSTPKVQPVTPSTGLGAMTSRKGITAPQEEQQADPTQNIQRPIIDIYRKIVQQEIGDGSGLTGEKIPYDPLVDTPETLAARGYNPDEVLRNSVFSSTISGTKGRTPKDKVLTDIEDLIQSYEDKRLAKKRSVSKERATASSSILDVLEAELMRGMTSKQTDTQPTVSADSSRDRFELQGDMRDLPVLDDEGAPEVDTLSNELLDKELPSDGLGSRPVAEEESSALMIPNNIDMSFLGEKEGFKLDAYIPEDKEGKVIDQSGVTVGTGVDLGSKNEEYFKDLKPSILNKLKPHFGKKREAAQKSLEENPFSLTEEEALVLDNFVKAKEFNVLKKRWDKDSEISWDDLTTNQATAIASVYYQHGNQTFGYNFWDQTTSGDWDSAYENLMTWGGSTPSRRRDEAALLKATN